MISLLVKLVIIVLLVLAIAGFLRTWQVRRGENQKAFLAGSAPNPAPNEFYNGKVQNMSTSWLGKMFNSAANSGINLFYNGDGTDVEKYPFKTYAGKGALDKQTDVLKIDYNLPENSWYVRLILDEIVQVAPNEYLGKILVKIIPGHPFALGYFTLKK